MSSVDSSKVYLFLSKNKNWQTEADKNSDGKIIKSEFRTYMEGNYNWNGEDASAKSDLINAFWKEIDTNQSGKLSKKLNNKGALDDSELNTINKKIEMYDILNDYIKSLNAPSVVSNKTQWKQSVEEGLTSKVEEYIKSGKSVEELTAYIAELAPVIERKATADYCANQYLANDMKNVLKNYSYAYADDSTLQSMINNYISQLGTETESIPTDEEIQETVQNIINEYFATAGLTESSSFDLSQYGYEYNDNSPLNDLQKSIVKTNLTNGLADIKNETDYEKYKSLYDEAVNSFIEQVLSDSTFGDFEKIQGYGMTEFKSNDYPQYNAVKKAVEVSTYMDSDEFKSALSSQISSSLSDVIFKGMSDERPEAYNTLVAEAMEKAKNGEFDDANGNLDQEKFKKYIIDNIKSNLDKYYENGFGDMTLEDLGALYDKLVEAAKTNDNSSAVKTAAISYCQAVSKKSTKLAQAVKDVFGSDYATQINGMKSYEIESKMTELKSKVTEIGDVSSCKLTGWSTNASDVITLIPNETKTFGFNANITNNNGTVSPDRISYEVNNSNVKIVDGVLTITAPSTASEYTVEIYATVDGERIGEAKKIKVSCQQKTSNDLKSEHGVKIGDNYIDDILKTHTQTMLISGFHRNSSNSLKDSKTAAKESIKNTITQLVADLTAAGYNSSKLQIAATSTINYYNAAIDAITDQEYGDRDQNYHNMSFTYVDGSGKTTTTSASYYQHTRKHEKHANKSDDCEKMGFDTTGIQMNESYNKTNTYNFYINVGVLLNRFMNFLNI